MASNGVTSSSKKSINQKIISSLCKHLSVDPQTIEEVNDVKTLFTNIVKASGKQTLLENTEVLNWVDFAQNFQLGGLEMLRKLNEDLTPKSVLLGDGFKISVADVLVFSAIHSFVIGLSDTDWRKYTNVLRWMDYIQNKEHFGQEFEKVPVEKIYFDFQASKNIQKGGLDLSSKKGGQEPKTDDTVKAESNSKKDDTSKAVSISEKNDKLEAGSDSKKTSAKKKTDSKGAEEKKKVPEKESSEKDAELSVGLLNIQVGLIRKAWKHPSADSLLVEEIDLGDGGVRQVVSGLAKYCSPDDLTNRLVALITNVKPGKLRDVASSGLVLCASNSEQTVVEPLLPPEGAKIGERVSFSGHDGKPEDVLNPKKKQLEKITPNLRTDDKGVATFKGIPFMTTAGPCTSSIPNASIK